MLKKLTKYKHRISVKRKAGIGGERLRITVMIF